MVSTLEQMQVPNGTGPGVRRSKRPLLASCTRCNVLWKPPKFGNKVNIGNKVQFGNKFANRCETRCVFYIPSPFTVFMKRVVCFYIPEPLARGL